MAKSEFIKDFYGRVQGEVITESNGNKKIKDFYGRLCGEYDAKRGITKDFYGRVVGSGNQLNTLLDFHKK